MFTGIIETTGLVKKINQKEIVLSVVLEDLKEGDSISLNGICLTIRNLKQHKSNFECVFDISPETHKRTNLKYLKVGDKVNIERALKTDSRLDGHLITGHVDDVSKILSIKKTGDAWEFDFSIPEQLNKFIAEKGSVAIDGISLTVAKKVNNRFSVSVIPYTFEKTNLKFKKAGDYVNIEVDILARYIHSILSEQIKEFNLKKILGENW